MDVGERAKSFENIPAEVNSVSAMPSVFVHLFGRGNKVGLKKTGSG